MTDRTKETLKNAVATTRGWVDPKTGELLVSIRGLAGAIAWSKELVADIRATKDVVVEAVADVIEDISEAVTELKADVAETVAEVKAEVAEAVAEIKEIKADKSTKTKAPKSKAAKSKKSTPKAE